MAKIKEEAPSQLSIGLYDPELTPLLRAGLGGLATASLQLGGLLDEFGSITVEKHRVVLDWREPKQAAPFFKALFEAAFALDKTGQVCPRGYFAENFDPPVEVRVALTDAFRLTFLQHGAHAKKDGAAKPLSFEIDEQHGSVMVQSYREYVHQKTFGDIAQALDCPPSKRKPIKLAGWANPGAVERHVGLGVTDIEYTPAEALCACFALVGCLSYQGPSRSGVLVVLEPDDLRLFANARPELSPQRLHQCIVASAGDGVLAIHAGLLTAELRDYADGVARISAMALRSTAWAKQQKSRTDTLLASNYKEEELEAFDHLLRLCPPKIVRTKGKKKGEPGGYWGIPSSLRGFVADNLAKHRPFYTGFGKAKTGDDPPRWLHRFHSKDDNLGALRYPDDQQGIRAMIDSLTEAEQLLVNSIHTGLRQRFGAIADENKDSSVSFGKRCQGEREKWRLAFSGARTQEQIRHALADFWSRAGTIKELQGQGWRTLQPLLGHGQWEAARDLSLIGLASYQGKGAEDSHEEGDAS